MNRKLYIIIFVSLLAAVEQVPAQFALPVFQAIHRRVSNHPGFSVTGLTFDNNAQTGIGDNYISIPWSSGLKAYTADDSSAFTVSIRAQLPVGSHYYRRNDYYTSPSHTLRGAYYWASGQGRILSAIYSSSGIVDSDLEYTTTQHLSSVGNHTTTWSGKYSENIQSIYYDSEYWYWIGYKGTADPSTGVYTSSSSGVKLWMKENGNSVAYNPNKTMSDVLVESSASGNYDFIRVTYSSLSDMTSGNSGTIVSTGLGGTGVGTGSINYVLDLDGTNDYVSLPNSINMGTSDFTVSIWLKADDVSSRQHVVQQTGTNANRVIAIKSDGMLTSRLGAPGFDLDSGVNIVAGTWYHVALVHDNSANTLKWYVNGTEHNTNTSVNIGTNTGSFWLGTNENGSKWFDGKIDEVRIWNDIRTASEIADNKDDELVGNESGLVAYYKMSDGTGTTLTDNSSNSYNGTLTNMTTSGASTDWVITNAPIAYDNVYTDYGPDGSYSTNCMYFYQNGSLVKAHGLTDAISGTTSGTGYLGRNVYDFGGGSNGPYTRLVEVTDWALINYCDPSSVSSLHSSQGSSDLRTWAADQDKSLAIYYSLTNAISDGDTVYDLSGNNRNGTANGF